jgi:MFS family permease
MFMEQLDGTVLATALPSMARELCLGAQPVHRLTLTCQSGGFAPVSGRIADRFGAHCFSQLSSSSCWVRSLSNAPNVPFLVVARFSSSGALMMPVGRLVLMRNVRNAT